MQLSDCSCLYLFIKTKMSKSIAILNRTKHILNEKNVYILYCKVPYIIYCVEVWGRTYKTNLNPIYRLQKKAVRIVKGLIIMNLQIICLLIYMH